MQIRAAEISEVLKEQIRDYEKSLDVRETGRVLTSGDGIARVYGLDRAASGELLEFPNEVYGMVLTGQRAAANRHQSHRQHDPDRPRAARADHR
jgi:F0F1-type ATP synthase alpha subunit